MRTYVRRFFDRAGRLLLRPVAQEQKELRRQLMSRIAALDKRVESALETALADARLLSARQAGRPAPQWRGRPLPRRAADLPPSRYPVPLDGPPPDGIVDLHDCPACGQTEWTAVCEFNRFLVVEAAPDPFAARYDYALCHGCGVVFARRRPVGTRFRCLLERFEETLGRRRKDAQRVHPFGSGPLSPDDAAHLRFLLSGGVLVSEAPGVRDRGIPALMRDRLASGPHVELLGSLLDLRAPRVLELRPRFGAIGAALRRLYGGETLALPLFEAQQFLVREAYGTRADALLDYDDFRIPYEGQFDLIVANHILTHAVRPAELLATLRSRLAPGGHLYLYNEPDEADFLSPGGKSMFKTLNPFHLQAFDADSLTRVLQVAGFEPTFVTHHAGNFVLLASVAMPPTAPEPIPAKVRQRRLDRYARARDWAILLLPDELRRVFADEWEQVLERGFAAGLVDFDPAGALRLVR